MSNPNQNQLSIALTNQEMLSIRQELDTIENTMPFLIELTPEEMLRMPKIDVSNHEFVRETISVLQTQEIPLPPNINLEEIQKDLELFNQINELLLRIDQLQKKMKHTATKAGSEAFVSSLLVYKVVQAYSDAGISGYAALYDRLKQRFSGQGGNNRTNSTNGND